MGGGGGGRTNLAQGAGKKLRKNSRCVRFAFKSITGTPWKFIELGNRLMDEENIDDSIEAFDKALNFNSNLAEAWVFKGVALVKSGKF